MRFIVALIGCFAGLVIQSQPLPDSSIELIQKIQSGYYKKIDSKIDQLDTRLIVKTKRTLRKLVKWEARINGLLSKTPFSNASATINESSYSFSQLLEQMEQAEAGVKKLKSHYSEYRDNLSNQLKFIVEKKKGIDSVSIRKIEVVRNKLDSLDKTIALQEFIQKQIQIRKKQLKEVCLKHLANSSYAKKIDKEVYYYVESVRNYKELFSSPAKREKLTQNILSKVPGYQKFLNENSQLASLFHLPSNGSTDITTA
ncbi:MAG TPA: hypothetical protein PKK69_03010, partial [Ferruginibacter sp.]|nr:hypothetical protein [Ferruginibacter sp.]